MSIGQPLASSLARPAVALLARLALVSAFLVSGILKALDFPAAVAEVRALAGLEPAALFAVVVIVTQIGGSLLVLLGGMWAVIGAALLAGFTALATLFGHAFWAKTGVEQVRDLTTFFEHLGLIGGFLLAPILVSSRRSPG